MNLKKLALIMICLLSSAYFNACQTPSEVDLVEDVEYSSDVGEDDDDEGSTEAHEEADDYTWNSASVVSITLNGTSIIVNGSGATVSGLSAGQLVVPGTLQGRHQYQVYQKTQP